MLVRDGDSGEANNLSMLVTSGSVTATPTSLPTIPIASRSSMGIFRVPIAVRNWQNQFLPPELKGEDATCMALVDSGAAELALPTEIIDKLRLEQLGTIGVRTADNSLHEYRVFGMVELEVQGRQCHVRVIELPRGSEPLLGAVPLEEMDWHISPLERKLLPNPQSPDKPLLPLC